MDINEEMEKFLEGFKNLTDELLEKVSENKKLDGDVEILDSIGEEYSEFIAWCFGVEGLKQTTKCFCKSEWARLHPNLPTPRIFQVTGGVDRDQATIGLMIDAYPLYIQETSKN